MFATSRKPDDNSPADELKRHKKRKMDERMPLTPCVVYSGPSLEQAEFLHLHVDNQNIFRVSNAEEGVTALMSAFFIFNIVYGRKAFNTSTVLERLFLGMSKTSPRAVAIKFVKKVVQAVRR
ncbi:hypothetical protein MTO96_052079 [Rhipicephalus appendiculatus]